MNLVLVHHWCNEPESGVCIIPFEYESKEKFVFDILDKFKNKEWKEYGEGSYKSYEQVEVFLGVGMNKFDIESIEHNIFTLDEWFDKNKSKITY